MKRRIALLSALAAIAAVVAVGVAGASGTGKCTFYVGTGPATQPCLGAVGWGSVTNGTGTGSYAVRWRNFMSCLGPNFPDSSYHMLVWYVTTSGQTAGIRQGSPGLCGTLEVTGQSCTGTCQTGAQVKAFCGIRQGPGNSNANITRQAFCFTEW